MKLSRRVALGGVQMDGLDVSVVIRGMDPGTAKKNVQTVSLMGGTGQRVTSRHYESIEASVTYAIMIPKKQLAARRAVFDKVNAWALAGGWLTMNCMEDRRLFVEDVTVPNSGDLGDWDKEFTITFHGYGVPFWQDDTVTTETIAAEDAGEGEITVPGMVETVCDAEITNAGESAIDTMSVSVGDSSFSFTSLGLAADEKLVISHGDDGTLAIRIFTGAYYNRSAMDKRTGGSADDLYVKPGDNDIAITGGTVTATVSCFGRYV